MAGIYIHIPFCAQACHYCNFHFSTSFKLKDHLLEALLKEIELRKHELDDLSFSTIYFGGGTPSLLTPEELERIISSLYQHYDIQCAEFTLEANPENCHNENLKAWKELGVSRLSIGVQTFREEFLQKMNRSHTARQSIERLREIKNKFSFELNLDLIYGQPWQSLKELRVDLETFVSFQPEHISAYALTIEEKTAFGHWAKAGAFREIEEDEIYKHYQLVTSFLAEHNYQQYEVSNFSKPGKQAMHNSSYWNGVPYIGFGPSAHSFMKGIRKWNIANNPSYVKKIKEGLSISEKEVLSQVDKFNEVTMTSLRTSNGLPIQILDILPEPEKAKRLSLIDFYRRKKWAVIVDGRFILNREGLFRADGIASEFFLV